MKPLHTIKVLGIFCFAGLFFQDALSSDHNMDSSFDWDDPPIDDVQLEKSHASDGNLAYKCEQDTLAFTKKVYQWTMKSIEDDDHHQSTKMHPTYDFQIKGNELKSPCGDLVIHRFFRLFQSFLDHPDKSVEKIISKLHRVFWHPSEECLKRHNYQNLEGGAFVGLHVSCGDTQLLKLGGLSGGFFNVSQDGSHQLKMMGGASLSLDLLQGKVKWMVGVVDPSHPIIGAMESSSAEESVSAVKELKSQMQKCARNQTLVVQGTGAGGMREHFVNFTTGEEQVDTYGYGFAFKFGYPQGSEETQIPNNTTLPIPTTEAPSPPTEAPSPPTEPPAATLSPTPMPTTPTTPTSPTTPEPTVAPETTTVPTIVATIPLTSVPVADISTAPTAPNTSTIPMTLAPISVNVSEVMTLNSDAGMLTHTLSMSSSPALQLLSTSMMNQFLASSSKQDSGLLCHFLHKQSESPYNWSNVLPSSWLYLDQENVTSTAASSPTTLPATTQVVSSTAAPTTMVPAPAQVPAPVPILPTAAPTVPSPITTPVPTVTVPAPAPILPTAAPTAPSPITTPEPTVTVPAPAPILPTAAPTTPSPITTPVPTVTVPAPAPILPTAAPTTPLPAPAAKDVERFAETSLHNPMIDLLVGIAIVLLILVGYALCQRYRRRQGYTLV